MIAAFILFFDCVFLFTLFSSVLTLKLELARIRESSAEKTSDATLAKPASATSARGPHGFDLTTIAATVKDGTEQNPLVSRFKLMLVCGIVWFVVV